MDEFGVSLTLGISYGWFPIGQRLEIPYEAPQGRRVNGIGLLISHGPDAGRLEYALRAKIPADRSKKARKSLEERAQAHGVCAEDVGPIDADYTLAFLWAAAGRPIDAPEDWRRERPLIVYLDNYSVHTSKILKAARAELAAANVFLVYLPSYTPEMSAIEPVWHDVKSHRMPRRSFDRLGDLLNAVGQTLAVKARDLHDHYQNRKLCDAPA